MELFDHKPRLVSLATTELPDSIRMGQRLTGMTSTQTSFPVAPSLFKFEQHGKSGAWVSELMPNVIKLPTSCASSNRCTPSRSITSAVTFLQTGFQLAGRPSIGAWLAYGLGGENKELPAFIVMISQGGNPNVSRWPIASGAAVSAHEVSRREVPFRQRRCSTSRPSRIQRPQRRRFIDDLGELNRVAFGGLRRSEISTRIAQYEMAYRCNPRCRS